MRTQLAAAGGSALALAVILGACLWFRGGADHDELHTLLLARLWAAGEPLSFHLGSVSRYEGGSWLIGLPVSWLLRLGVPDWLAGPAVAGTLAVGTVAATSAWLARTVGPRAAAFGLLVGASAPAFLHYAQRAWGSVAEALIFVPLLALAYARWSPGRRIGGAVLLGAVAGLGLVVSYVTVIAVVAGAVVHGLERRDRRAAAEIGLALLAVAVVFGGWILLAVPQPEEAWVVRGGHSLGSLVGEAWRLDRGVPLLLGALTAPPPASVAQRVAGVLLTGLGAAALGRALRTPGPLRWLGVYTLACLPFLAAGALLSEAPESHRYALPASLALLAAIVAWGRAPLLVALLLGLPLWLPPPEPPRHDPVAVYAQLGGNALDRVHPDRHATLKAFWRAADPWGQAPLLCGYGLDQGRRFEHVVAGARARLAEGGDPADLHLAPRDLDPWLSLVRGLGDQRDAYLLCLGRGLLEDGRLGPEEQELLDHAPKPERLAVERGLAVARGEIDPSELPPARRHLATLQVRPTPLPRD